MTGSISNGTPTISVFIVATAIFGMPQWTRFFGFGGASDYNNIGNMLVGWNQSGGITVERNQAITPTINPITTTTPFITSTVISGTSILGYINGTNTLTGTTTNTNFTYSQYEVGSYTGFSGLSWNGYIGEIVVYNAGLTTLQRQQVEGYLAWKWGLQASLSNGHPYAAAVPTVSLITAFSPTSITGCKLWLDAADINGNGTATANGATITTWVDKSGNGNNFTGYNTPVYATNVKNSLGGITMVNANSTYLQAATIPTNSGTTCTLFVMCYLGTATGSARLFATSAGLSSEDYSNGGNFMISLDNNLSLYRAGGTSYASSPGNSYLLLSAVYDGTNGNLYLAGTNIGTIASSGNFSFNSAAIGKYIPGGGYCFNGYAMEYIMYYSAFTTTQRQQVEGYLAWKWGLQASLPGSHPYASTNPNPTINNKISAIPYYTQFSPLQIANCQLWLDASDSSTSSMTFSSGSNLSVWKDKSGNGNNFSLTTGTTTRINDGGYSVVNFPSGALMTSANQITFSSSSAFFIVCKTTSGFGYAVGFTNITSGDYGIRFINGVLQGTTAAQGYNVDDLGNTTYYVNGVFNLPTTTTTYNLISTTNPQYSGTTTLTLSTTYNSRYFVGTIAEFIYYPTGVTATQRQQLESYLAQKWGLTSQLPNFSGPTAITGCKLWLDANDPAGTGATPTNGQAITTWVNKTSGFLNLTGSASISTYGGRNSMSFTNALSLTTTTSSVPMTSVSCFMVWVQSTSYGNVALLNLGTNLITWQSDCIGFYSDASVTKPGGTPGYRIYSGSTTLTGTAYTTATTADAVPFHILEITIDASGNMTVYRNGTSFQTGTRPASWGGTLTVCGFGEDLRYNTPAGAAQASCFVSEVIAYSSVLTTTQRQQVEGYLAVKWGLQSSLPTSHPYYATNPIHLNFTTVIGRDPIVAAIVPTVQKGISAYSPTTYSIVTPYIYTGANQSFTVPLSIYPPIVTVYMWGAGGGGSTGGHPTNYGGAGAYVQGTLFVAPGETLNVIVGQGGVAITVNGAAAAATYGGGGGVPSGGSSTQNSSGGGRSAIQRSSTDIVTAGGGGGSGMTNHGTNPTSPASTLAGGAAAWIGTASAGDYPPGISPYTGQGGTPSAGGASGATYGAGGATNVGTSGSLYTGGTAGLYGGGGGGGYYGGGGGNGGDGGYGRGGGGGSSFTALLTNATGSNSTNGYAAPNTASSYYQSGAGAGGTTGVGGNGLVIITCAIMNPIISSGGTVILNGIYRVHSFTTVGTTTFTLSSPVPIQAQLLVVGGGGSGGGWNDGGGGGAGGLVYMSSVTLTSGTYSIVVGAGGTGTSAAAGGNSGSNSSAFGYIGLGGGAGGCDTNIAGGAGGCGGGGGFGTAGGAPTQAGGYAGGRGTYGAGGTGAAAGAGGSTTGAGGGGMGSAGTNLVGGSGVQYSISGTAQFYAAGGGAGTDSTSVQPLGGSGIGGNGGYRLNTASGQPSAGAANTGSGGGALSQSLGGFTSGAGGSGIVILSFLN